MSATRSFALVVVPVDDLEAIVERVVIKTAMMLGRGSPASNDQLVGPDEAGVPRRSWCRAVKSGELRASKVGREYRATRAAVAEWLASKAVRPPNEAGTDDDELTRALRRSTRR